MGKYNLMSKSSKGTPGALAHCVKHPFVCNTVETNFDSKAVMVTPFSKCIMYPWYYEDHFQIELQTLLVVTTQTTTQHNHNTTSTLLQQKNLKIIGF